MGAMQLKRQSLGSEKEETGNWVCQYDKVGLVQAKKGHHSIRGQAALWRRGVRAISPVTCVCL
jgi:hypothetical protein